MSLACRIYSALIGITLAIMALSATASDFLCRDGGYCPPMNSRPSRPSFPRPDYPGNPGHPGYPGNPGPYPPAPGNPGYFERREIFIGRYLRDENLDLLQLARLNSTFDRGTVIESVEFVGRDGGSSRLLLLADGMIVAQNSFPGSYGTIYPNRFLQLGQTVRQVDLAVRGKLWVDQITLRIRSQYPNPGPGPGFTLERILNQNIFTGRRLDLPSLFSLYQFVGYRIFSVTILAESTTYNSSVAHFLVNGGFAGSASFGRYAMEQTIYPPNMPFIGAGYNDLQLLFEGSTQIQSIRLNLVR